MCHSCMRRASCQGRGRETEGCSHHSFHSVPRTEGKRANRALKGLGVNATGKVSTWCAGAEAFKGWFSSCEMLLVSYWKIIKAGSHLVNRLSAREVGWQATEPVLELCLPRSPMA